MTTNKKYIEGWLSDIEGDKLAELADGKVCLEIGSYMGKSANFIAPKAKLLYCIDLFKADEYGQEQMDEFTTLEKFKENTRIFKNIVVVIGDSQKKHDMFGNKSLGLIFIDGMHDYDSVMADIKNYLPKLEVGGYLCLHDYNPVWGVFQAVNEVFGEPDMVFDSLAVIQKK